MSLSRVFLTLGCGGQPVPGKPLTVVLEFDLLVWWLLPRDWKLASLHQDPEFIALLNELEADILEQRQWYEENRDKPLL